MSLKCIMRELLKCLMFLRYFLRKSFIFKVPTIIDCIIDIWRVCWYCNKSSLPWYGYVLAFINYNLFYKGFTSGNGETINSTVAVLDRDGCLVCFETCIVENGIGNISGRIEVNSPMLWWPYLMNSDPGYLYTVEVRYTPYIRVPRPIF